MAVESGMGKLVVGLLALVVLAAGASEARAITLENGRFVSVCKFSHALRDDPIVYPGQPGLSHLHHFFGNHSTNARSTPRKLRRRSGTTCTADDRSAYWIPALIAGDRAVAPIVMRAYYASFTRNPRTIQAPPKGLRVIAGDGAAATPQPTGIAAWSCYSGPLSGAGGLAPAPGPYCDNTERLALSINFPECWDGVNLDSPDHRSHMAYAEPPSLLRTYASCPATHPVPIPALQLKFVYPTSGARSGLELSSGGVYSAHADFVNGWPQRKLEDVVANCIRRAAECRS